ncbi:hypothetical protein GALMADRAFT_143710 [Galerina marginata CBS 339.88]|uniref:G-protein coupled receptors family 1 profile domain-containing protein n=1 Tax=Galerina marginata (strain CBS 339.88) TaxID=685588 RepID=A0A067SXI1_GALM3|nr:hypothetical protein GALMADRAFT_143710 [Galerina marginata CBS 339.88]
MVVITQTSPGIRVDTAQLAGIFVEGPLYGIFLILDAVAINILTRRRRRTSFNPVSVTAAILMLLLATAQFIADCTNVAMGFIPLESRALRQSFFLDLTQPIYAASITIYFTMILVGDFIVIYRCYVVWNKNFWIILIPMLCSLGSGACAYQTIWAIRHLTEKLSFIRLEESMGFAVFGLSFSANAISTGLLSYKIWTADRNLRKTLPISSTGRRLTPVLRIVLESGIVNTLYLLAYTIILDNGTDGIAIMSNLATPLIGIIFTTVIIRAALSAEAESSAEKSTRISGGGLAFASTKSQSQNGNTLNGLEPVIEVKGIHPDHEA